MDTKYKFKLTIHHTQPVKSLFDVLQSILSEATIKVLPGEIKYSKKALEADDIDLIEDSDEDDNSDKDSDDSESNDSDDDNKKSKKKKQKILNKQMPLKQVKKQTKKQVEEEEDEDEDEDEEEDNKKNEDGVKKPEPGLKISAVDQTKTILVHVRIKEFTYFKCDETHDLGVNMKSLHKHIKTLDKEDTIDMYVEDSDENQLWLEFNNPESERTSKIGIGLRELDDDKISLPITQFSVRIVMSANDFNKIIKEMSSFASEVVIEIRDNQVKFSCKSAIAQRETILKYQSDKFTDLKIQWDKSVQKENVPNIYSQKFELKFLSLFAKCHTLSQHVEIFAAQEKPLLLRYDVGKIGSIVFCMAPRDITSVKSSYEDVKDDYGDAKVKAVDDDDDDYEEED
jgi:proliferating cell nuclear antigen PCNA